MLVFLTGSTSIFKTGFAFEIARILNNYDNYQIGEYIVNFGISPIEVYTKTGDLVFRAGTPDVEEISRLMRLEGKEFVDSIAQFDADIIIETTKTNHYHTTFHDLGFDLGIFEEESFEAPYEDFINAYHDRKVQTQVVSGVFSKNFIDKVRADIGDENVHVLAVSRHPSVAFLMDHSPQGLSDDIDPSLEIGQSIIESALNSVVMNSQSDSCITKIRFEDIIKNKSVTLMGKVVPLPFFEGHNEYITKYEYDNLITSEQVVAKGERINIFNDVFCNLSTYTGRPKFTNDVFAALGYTPLTYEDVVAGTIK